MRIHRIGVICMQESSLLGCLRDASAVDTGSNQRASEGERKKTMVEGLKR